jgi:SpoVK/Ycf46/Vps4 family AAA+-type ATPase
MDRLLSLLLVELDGVARAGGPPVVLLAAASAPSALDPALLRPGRLDVLVFVPPPSRSQVRRVPK